MENKFSKKVHGVYLCKLFYAIICNINPFLWYWTCFCFMHIRMFYMYICKPLTAHLTKISLLIKKWRLSNRHRYWYSLSLQQGGSSLCTAEMGTSGPACPSLPTMQWMTLICMSTLKEDLDKFKWQQEGLVDSVWKIHTSEFSKIKIIS